MPKALIKKLIFISVPIYLFFHYFIYWDTGNGCFIKIKPAILEFSNLGMKRALKALKYAAPEDYKKVCENVKTINPFIACGGFGGGCVYGGDPETYKGGGEIYISTVKDDLARTMAIIVHETCHVIQGKNGRPFEEGECYAESDRILRGVVVF